MKEITILLLVVVTGITSGCSVFSPPLLGGAAGAATGAVLSHGNPLLAGAGAAVGAGMGALVASSSKASYQRGLDDGYLQGASDAVKRLYWAKQRLEGRPTSSSSAEVLLEGGAEPSEEPGR